MPDLSGATLGPYRVKRRIGRGGMSTVYQAYQPVMARDVAIKVLPEELAEDPNFLVRFEREAKVVANLQHTNILPVFDYGQEDGVSYLVMPYIASGTLSKYMAGVTFSLEEAARLFGQIAEAVDYAHRRGILHRDIKPSNVLMDDSDNALLTDFGLTRIVEGTSNLTGTGVVGTPTYMSPEQGQGWALDVRSDIYSLGVILYEMLVGEVPFSAENPIAVIFKHVNEPLPMPRSRRPDLPASMEEVILRGLAKSPEDRFQSASAMAAMLRASAHQTMGNHYAIRVDPVNRITPREELTAVDGVTPTDFDDKSVAPFYNLASPVPPATSSLPDEPTIAVPAEPGTQQAPMDESLVPRLYEQAFQVYCSNDYPEAHELLLDLLVIAPQYTDAQNLLKLVERKLPGHTPSFPAAVHEHDNVPEPSIPRVLPPPFEWVRIPAGTFLMGSTRDQVDLLKKQERGDWAQNEFPQVTVELPTYYIAKYPITYAQYEEFVNDDGYSNDAYWTVSGLIWRGSKTHPEGHWQDWRRFNAMHPVVGVTWYEASAFCRWLQAKTGFDVRLPTEVEWEKAARGTDGRTFPWGNKWDPTKLNSSGRIGKTTPVIRYSGGMSPYGVMDMSGNVWEWCLTKWGWDYRGGPALMDNDTEDVQADQTLSGGSPQSYGWRSRGSDWYLDPDVSRVLRGGSWNLGPGSCRCACRSRLTSNRWDNNRGFRVMVGLDVELLRSLYF